jgi:5-methylcytosine-specific restriction endonuclease McrA
VRNETPQQRARISTTAEQRRRVYTRDGYRCVDCGRPSDLTIDHVVPLALEVKSITEMTNSLRGAGHATAAKAVSVIMSST